ncbi:hypothetical protein PHMEG_00041432 [Phytophthora megakarya]|uniref:Uncharacterized protein n=1 Tax=Phytophthora megakarya TaxID=4795 RepID=A0A225UEA4_9STRA|nr:hypothetical protein PHMEG_00041432 [Phytophthora megakarya]
MKEVLSGNRERPCSSDVFVRICRRNRTFPEDTDRLHCLYLPETSDARPNAYHMMQRRAAS